MLCSGLRVCGTYLSTRQLQRGKPLTFYDGVGRQLLDEAAPLVGVEVEVKRIGEGGQPEERTELEGAHGRDGA